MEMIDTTNTVDTRDTVAVVDTSDAVDTEETVDSVDTSDKMNTTEIVEVADTEEAVKAVEAGEVVKITDVDTVETVKKVVTVDVVNEHSKEIDLLESNGNTNTNKERQCSATKGQIRNSICTPSCGKRKCTEEKSMDTHLDVDKKCKMEGVAIVNEEDCERTKEEIASGTSALILEESSAAVLTEAVNSIPELPDDGTMSPLWMQYMKSLADSVRFISSLSEKNSNQKRTLRAEIDKVKQELEITRQGQNLDMQSTITEN